MHTLRNEEGAGNAGCALHPRSRVLKCAKKRTRAYRFSGGSPASPAQWFDGLYRALPGEPGFLATIIGAMRSIIANLTPASGRQDHTTLPYAKVPFVVRYVCVHRIPVPRFVTTRNAPQVDRNGKSHTPIFSSEKAKYFSRGGWTNARDVESALRDLPVGAKVAAASSDAHEAAATLSAGCRSRWRTPSPRSLSPRG